MVSSAYNNQHVVYVDALQMVHSGIIVGQSEDGRWLLVQSDNPVVPPADWHFRIAAENVDLFLKK